MRIKRFCRVYIFPNASPSQALKQIEFTNKYITNFMRSESVRRNIKATRQFFPGKIISQNLLRHACSVRYISFHLSLLFNLISRATFLYRN